MNYTVLIKSSDNTIQLVMPGNVSTAQFDSETFETRTINTAEDNLITELNGIDATWVNRFDVRITPKPIRKV